MASTANTLPLRAAGVSAISGCARTALGLLLGLLQVVAARHEDDHLGHRVADLAVGDGARRLALLVQQVRWRRRPRPSRGSSDRPRTAAPPSRGRTRRSIGRRRPCSFTAATRARRASASSAPRAPRASRSVPDGLELGDDVLERVRDRARPPSVGRRGRAAEGLLDLPGRHRAHPAQVLREDHVGLLAPEQVGVEHVERLLGVHAFPHRRVDLARTERPALGERAAGDDRLRHRVGREVALVGDADQVVAQAEGVHDLGGRRQQGHDLHAGKSPRRSPVLQEAHQVGERTPRGGAVEHPVVERAAQGAGRPGDDLAVHDERPRPDHADRQGDAGPGRQDRGARLAAVAARVADGDGRPGHLGGRERSRAGAVGEALDLGGEIDDAVGSRRRAAPARSALVRCRRRCRRGCAARTSTSPSCHRALSTGCSATVSRQRRDHDSGSGEIPSSPRRASSAVQSTVRNIVTCGMAACRSRLSAIARRVEPANVEPAHRGTGVGGCAGAAPPRRLRERPRR